MRGRLEPRDESILIVARAGENRLTVLRDRYVGRVAGW
jgi:hypothetical protein